ncbi:hypothetical protein FA13DRAFT_554362 [Coprinellus micaceus]|uniref:Uncharacterized protein n=1 Tax=Coprinellus micaceus TaxID=71717 RepID=A0A4Y7T947_COPMI|nr:hypothetical protein FA13DRAFT_554362 [Coprinellus micaceus]
MMLDRPYCRPECLAAWNECRAGVGRDTQGSYHVRKVCALVRSFLFPLLRCHDYASLTFKIPDHRRFQQGCRLPLQITKPTVRHMYFFAQSGGVLERFTEYKEQLKAPLRRGRVLVEKELWISIPRKCNTGDSRRDQHLLLAQLLLLHRRVQRLQTGDLP